jgi:hypothetical protein
MVGRTGRIELSPPPPQLSSPQLFSSSFISLVRIPHPLCLPFVTCIYSNHPPLPPTESFPLALRSPPHRPISFVDSFGRRLPLSRSPLPLFHLTATLSLRILSDILSSRIPRTARVIFCPDRAFGSICQLYFSCPCPRRGKGLERENGRQRSRHTHLEVHTVSAV